MTRLELSKKLMHEAMLPSARKERLNLIYQESINRLPTYKEQKEFHEFYMELTKEKANV